jgi:hypothetical protein
MRFYSLEHASAVNCFLDHALEVKDIGSRGTGVCELVSLGQTVTLSMKTNS